MPHAVWGPRWMMMMIYHAPLQILAGFLFTGNDVMVFFSARGCCRWFIFADSKRANPTLGLYSCFIDILYILSCTVSYSTLHMWLRFQHLSLLGRFLRDITPNSGRNSQAYKWHFLCHVLWAIARLYSVTAFRLCTCRSNNKIGNKIGNERAVVGVERKNVNWHFHAFVRENGNEWS